MANKEAIMMALLEAMEDGSSAPKTSLRPKMRPKMIGGMSGGSSKGIDPRDNYSEEDLKTLLRSSGSAKGMMGGGKVKGYKHGGAVMAGRGGTFKGCK